MVKSLLCSLKDQFFARWITCRLISDRKSVQYGIRFSYPIYILIVFLGVILQNPYIFLIAALIAFLGIKLPLHPFDYIYNFLIVKVTRANKIASRGSELQVNSTVALVFNLIVFALVVFQISINYEALSIIYVLSSIFFIGIFLFKD